MELDDFKSVLDRRSKAAPEDIHLNNEKMKTFIDEMMAVDEADRKKNRTYMVVFGLFVAVYASTGALQKGGMQTGYTLLVIGFLLSLGFIYLRYRRLKEVNYTAPLTVFLRDALQRHRFMPPSDLLISLFLVLLYFIGGSIIVYVTFTRYFPGSLVPLLVYIAVMILATSLGFWASYRQWKEQKGWIVDRIVRMLKELDG